MRKTSCTAYVWQGEDDDGDEVGEEGDMGSGFPSGSFRPGKVVWAKVDGHEWWPAKVGLCNYTYMHFAIQLRFRP